ncbi:MAG: hypothetical protein LBU34_13935 [Planctomycetaceae bacterium]|nr:hypothetical protein [Planctomycetaceae bacterium]
MRLTFHKVGNRSPNGCVGVSRQRIYVIWDIGIGGFCAETKMCRLTPTQSLGERLPTL